MHKVFTKDRIWKNTFLRFNKLSAHRLRGTNVTTFYRIITFLSKNEKGKK